MEAHLRVGPRLIRAENGHRQRGAGGLGRDLTALKLPRRLVRGIVVEMDPAHPIPDVGHQCIVAILPGQLQSATEVGGGNAELAGVKRGPSS